MNICYVFVAVVIVFWGWGYKTFLDFLKNSHLKWKPSCIDLEGFESDVYDVLEQKKQLSKNISQDIYSLNVATCLLLKVGSNLLKKFS